MDCTAKPLTKHSWFFSLSCVAALCVSTHPHAQESRLKLSQALATVPSAIDRPSSIAIPSVAWQFGPSSCSNTPKSPLGLVNALQNLSWLDVLQQSLCRSPALQQSLLNVQEQQATVNLAQNAFRPRFGFNSSLSSTRDTSSGVSRQNQALDANINLSWIAFDFGARQANLQQTQQLLIALTNSQDTALLGAIGDTLKNYSDAAIAWARLDAAQEAESIAKQSYAAADAKYQAQVASLAEKFQAQTALAQATLDKVRAQGAWESARATLAVNMAYPANQVLSLQYAEAAKPVNASNTAGSFSDDEVNGWIEVAKSAHPRLLSLRAEVASLQAKRNAVDASGKGTLSLAANAGFIRDSFTAGGATRSLGGNALLNIPLFNGSEQKSLFSQVDAQIQTKESVATAVAREIELNVWKTAIMVRNEQQNMVAASQLVSAAQISYNTAWGRYKAGAGSIQELLNAQANLASAKTQSLVAAINNKTNRLQFVLSLGKY